MPRKISTGHRFEHMFARSSGECVRQLTGHEGCLGEQIGETVPAGGCGRADPGLLVVLYSEPFCQIRNCTVAFANTSFSSLHSSRSRRPVSDRPASHRLRPFADRAALTATHRVSVSRFAAPAGIPERAYCRRLAPHRAGSPVKGPWASPEVDQVEAAAAKYAAGWPVWRHRKIAAMTRVDGHQVSTSTVERVRAAAVRVPRRPQVPVVPTRVFRDPPRERNRGWQRDFSEFETARGGSRQICVVIDYATKYYLAATVTRRLAVPTRVPAYFAPSARPNGS